MRIAESLPVTPEPWDTYGDSAFALELLAVPRWQIDRRRRSDGTLAPDEEARLRAALEARLGGR